MMCGITGTPGTGKTAVAEELQHRGYAALAVTDTVSDFIIGEDPARSTRIVDEEEWASAFPRIDGFVEGHLSHLLPCEKVVVLRCRPDILRRRLEARGYAKKKVDENVSAEALDVILIETLERHPDDAVFELDTSNTPPGRCADLIEQFIQGKLPPTYGSVDWSEYLLSLAHDA